LELVVLVTIFIWVGVLAISLVAFVVSVAMLRRAMSKRNEVTRQIARQEALNQFGRQRELLEAEFLKLAGASGRPRGLAWVKCDFSDDYCLAKDRSSGQLRAMVGVEISFEAIEGGGMEDNPNVANVRAGSGLFNYDGDKWSTEGRAIFNLEPADAILHFKDELEAL